MRTSLDVCWLDLVWLGVELPKWGREQQPHSTNSNQGCLSFFGLNYLFSTARIHFFSLVDSFRWIHMNFFFYLLCLQFYVLYFVCVCFLLEKHIYDFSFKWKTYAYITQYQRAKQINSIGIGSFQIVVGRVIAFLALLRNLRKRFFSGLSDGRTVVV